MTMTNSNESTVAVQNNSNAAIDILSATTAHSSLNDLIKQKTMELFANSNELLDLIDSVEEEMTPELKTARHTIVHEITGLALFLSNLQEETFQKAVETLAKVKQRRGEVVFVGLGKTGHISKKASATMGSVGIKSKFLHSTECNHGDIGNIDPEYDAIIMVSNSGETQESFNTAEYCREKNMPLIVMTSSPNSTLGKMATITLDLFCKEEACHMGLAPTTSTTVALAFCDALANALSEKIGFTPDDFGASHPSGKLGMKQAPVRKNMHSPAPIVGMNATVSEAVEVIRDVRKGGVIIKNTDGTVAGFLSEGDFTEAFRNKVDPDSPVTEIMTVNPTVVHQEIVTEHAYNILKKAPFSVLIVVNDDDKPVGVLDVKDLQKMLG